MVAPNAYSNPVRPRGGTIVVVPEVWTSDIRGNRREDITEYMRSGKVTYDWTQQIPGQFVATFDGEDVATALVDSLVPIVTVIWKDATGTEYVVKERLGTFTFEPPDVTYDDVTRTTSVTAYDPVWAFSQMTADRLYTIKPDSGYFGDWASTIAYGRTNINLQFPKTDVRPGVTTRVRPNDNVLTACNDLFSRAVYWPIVATRGAVVGPSGKRTQIYNQPLARVITAQDVIGEIQATPSREQFYNQVYITSSSATADLTLRDGYKVSLPDDDPWSARSLGYYKTLAIADDKDQDLDSMRQRAISALETVGSMQRRITIPVWPDPRFAAREAWNLNIRMPNKMSVAGMRYRTEKVEFDLTAGAYAQVVTLAGVSNLYNVI